MHKKNRINAATHYHMFEERDRRNDDIWSSPDRRFKKAGRFLRLAGEVVAASIYYIIYHATYIFFILHHISYSIALVCQSLREP